MTTDEYPDEKRVADLEVGDDVRDYGVIVATERAGMASPMVSVKRSDAYRDYWPAHARVDVRRPVEVTVEELAVPISWVTAKLFIGTDWTADFRSVALANDVAERLRGSADERRKALGQ